MNLFDLAILVLLAAFLVKGLWRGLFRESCSLAGFIIGGGLALRFHAPLAEWMANSVGLPLRVWAVMMFVVLFLATFIFFSLVGMLLSRFVDQLYLGGFNRVVGGFLGLAQGTVLLALLLFSASRLDLPAGMQKAWHGSQLSPPFERLGESAFNGSQSLLARFSAGE